MTSPLQDQLQRTLGDGYTLERELGGGGMSRVFVATETALGRRVVVKALPPELAAAVSAERFRREIQLAASLQHPHIVPVLTAGTSEGLPYFTMPFVAGESLRARLTRDGPLPIRDVTAILRDVTQAIAYAHANGVVHRDIKPDNIMLSGGVAMVTDFGVAKAISAAGAGGNITSAGFALGTPAYMAPEQASGDPLSDQRADLYALGAVAYEMLCGQMLFPGRSPQHVIVAHAIEKPKPVRECRPETPPALAALVMQCLEKDPANRPATASDVLRQLDSGTPASPPRRRGLLVAASLAAVALLVVAGYLALFRRTAATSGDRSIAVLPFENASGEQENEYFGDGMAEELINGLSKVPGLRVAARTSAFAFKGKNDDVREIGRKLNVASVLEGSVRKSGSRLRVNARLVDASNGSLLWSDEYQRDLTDVFTVQDELARAIVGALQLQLAPGGGSSLVRRGTANIDAYNLYLRGRFFFEKRTHDGLTQGMQYFSQAITADSNYAAAYSGLADSYSLLTTFGFNAPRELMPQAKAAALRSVALDSTLAEGRTSLGFIYLLYDWDYPAADPQLRRAIELDPRYTTARLFRSWYLVAVGERAEAVREVERARAIDPLSLILNSRAAIMLFFDQRYEEAAAQQRRTLELDPDYGIARNGLARAEIKLGRCADALVNAKRASPLVGPWEAAVLGYTAAACGDRALAQHELNARLDELKRGRYVPADVLAKIYAGLGDKPHALDWLERGYEDRVWAMCLLQVEPMYDNLRQEPRFQTLVRKMKLR